MPHLRATGEGYASRALAVLTEAVTRGERDDRQSYGPVSVEAILGPIESAIDAYVASMAAAWEGSWSDGEAHALDGTGYTPSAPLTILPSDYNPLVVDSRAMVDYDRAAVRSTVAAGMDDGLSPTQIARLIDAHEAFGPARALRIARTENVRSQESGYDRRIRRAAADGVPVVGNAWLSDPLAARWERRHDLMHDKEAPIGGKFRLPSGVETEGPGLSGDPGEDVNCRCARAPVVRRAT